MLDCERTRPQIRLKPSLPVFYTIWEHFQPQLLELMKIQWLTGVTVTSQTQPNFQSASERERDSVTPATHKVEVSLTNSQSHYWTDWGCCHQQYLVKFSQASSQLTGATVTTWTWTNSGCSDWGYCHHQTLRHCSLPARPPLRLDTLRHPTQSHHHTPSKTQPTVVTQVTTSSSGSPPHSQ